MDDARQLIFGTQYYRAPLPDPQEWERDVETIKRLGMNTVKLFPQWRWHERVHGRFTWDDIDRLFDLCERNELLVYVNIILDVAPDWVFRGGRGLRVSNKGTVKRPTAVSCRSIGGWEPCFDDLTIRTDAEPFLKGIVERYKDHPSLVAWDIWNEPRNRWGDCACPASCASYHDWLKREFQDVEKLNAEFGKAWTSFEDVVPPVLLCDYGEMYLWRQWAMYSVADRVAWASDVARAVDNAHPVIAHAGGCSVIQDVMDDTCDDWLVARGVDSYGSSLSVAAIPSGPFIQNTMPGLHCDWLRNLATDFWIPEFYPDSPGWEPPLAADELKLQLWSAIAHGAKKILFWQYRPERAGHECNSDGLVELDGSLNDRSEMTQELFRVVWDNAELFANCQPHPAEVALLYDQKPDLISRIESTTGDSYTSSGSAPYFHAYKASLQGSYALFWENGVPVDVLSVRDISRIHKYRLVYLPAPYIVDDDTARELAAFVQNGGVLVSEAGLQLRAENAWLNTTNPTKVLADVFGATEKGRENIDEMRDVDIEALSASVPVTRMVTRLGLSGDTESWASWSGGEDAMTMNSHGDGKAVLLGFNPGATYVDTADRRLVTWIKALLDQADVNPPVPVTGAGADVQVRVLTDGQRRLLILANYGDAIEQFELAVTNAPECVDLTGVAEIRKTPAGLHVSLPAREVAVVALK